jgi:hypothetical protein
MQELIIRVARTLQFNDKKKKRGERDNALCNLKRRRKKKKKRERVRKKKYMFIFFFCILPFESVTKEPELKVERLASSHQRSTVKAVLVN